MKNGKHTDSDGTQFWYKDGNLHREDGPAIIYPFGSQRWYINGNIHREDGPAYISPNGNQIWYKDGNIHREDGPAYILPNGYQSWWLNDKDITNDITNWAKDRNIDLNNLSDNDKMVLKIEIRMWK
jgi:hypothetical protein